MFDFTSQQRGQLMLTMFFVFAFLGSWRSALVPLVTIPISLIGAMAAMMARMKSAMPKEELT